MTDAPSGEDPSPAGLPNDFLARSAQAARRSRWMKIAIFGFLAVAILAAIFWRERPRTQQVIKADYVWVQMLPDGDGGHGGRLVRVIMEHSDECPPLLEDGRKLNMRKRVARVRSAFPVLICERELGAATDARVGSDRLPVRPSNPGMITVVGDTGCRLVHYKAPQPCYDVAKWPFRQIADVAGKLTRNHSGAILIHVGDFHYREKPCDDGDHACGGSPFGDNWDTWKQEFFEPARALLLAAPWVILRGNHENCERAGVGWLFFFALPNQAFDGVCQDDRPRYVLNIGETASRQPRVLLVLDTANEADTYKMQDHCRDYVNWIAQVAPPTSEVWLALHQPLWFLGRQEATGKSGSPGDDKGGDCASGGSALNAVRSELRASPRNDHNPRFTVVLSGDTHMFQVFRPHNADLPTQIVAGNGGTALDKLDGLGVTPSTNGRVDLEKFASFGVDGAVTAIVRHGFVVLRRSGDVWSAGLQDVTGQPIASCAISEPNKGGGSPAGAIPCRQP